MSTHAQDPTPDQLTAMAYVDGELPPDQRGDFEARLARDPTLAREVSELQGLAVLARRMAPPEPADFEWKRLADEPLQRGATGIGFALIALATLGLAGTGLVALFGSELAPLTKWLVASGVAGVVLLFLTTARARLRVLPYDPYTHIER